MAENKWVGWRCFTPKEVKLIFPLLVTSFMGHFVGGGFNPTGMLFGFLGDIYGLEPRIFTFTFDRGH